MSIVRAVRCALIAIALCAAPLAAAGQQPPKVARVGVLMSAAPERQTAELDAFVKRLAELGWLRGQNLKLEIQWTDDPGALDRTAVRLLQAGVDVILAPGPDSIRAAMRATSTAPIVMIGSSDPRTVGIESLARPGGNLTGLTIGEPSATQDKRLELLKEAIPGLSRLTVLIDVDRAQAARASMDAAARSLGLTLQHVHINDVRDFAAGFRSARTSRADAVIVVEGPRAVANRELIARLSLEYRLPVISQFSAIVEAGGLMSYGPNLVALFQQAAVYVDKILKGANAAELPIEQPRQYDLVINMKTARSLRMTIPQSLLLRADRIID